MTSLYSAWILVPLIPLLVLLIDPDNLQELLRIATSALAGTTPYILFAVLMLAYLKATQAENMVSEAFQGRENRMIVLAAIFGGLAPFCSCEVIPFIAGLLALGAPISAVMAFWLSSPLIDPPSLMITAGALGWEFAIGKAIAAILLGLLGGFGVKFLLHGTAFSQPLKSDSISRCSSGSCTSDKPFSGKPHWKFWNEASQRKVFKEQGIENALFLFKWLSVAYLLEALLILYIPASLIGSIVGGEGVTPVVLGALVGMPAYLNSYAAPPLVAGLMEQGMSTGSAMAFMVAGAISSIPAMIAVWSLVKKPVFAAYLGFGVGGAILVGVIFGMIYT
ncbi:MAG: permease [Proteobacteria bacterium]|nr:permease [Pseudomonadota bacterium]